MAAHQAKLPRHPLPTWCCTAEHDVWQAAQPLEEADVLEGPHHAEPGDGVGLEADQLLAMQLDRAPVGLDERGEKVEHRGLARAVRTDQRGDHTLAQRHAELVGGHDAPEALRELLDLEGDGGLSPTVNRSVALHAGTRDDGDRGLQVLLLGLGEPLDRLTHCRRPPFGAEHLDAARQRPWPASQAPQRRSFGHQAARVAGR